MPELPEVEYAVRRLRRVLVGRRITAVEVLHASQRRQLPPRDRRALVGRHVIAVERLGKHQLLRIDDGATLLVHFRLDGAWEAGKWTAAVPRHTRVRLRLGERFVSLTDPRALCTLKRYGPGRPPRLRLGPDPEDPALTNRDFHERLSSRRVPIKPLLLDQALLAGVGNIYATEACWHARIHPALPSDRLTPKQAGRILSGLRRTLADGHVNAGRYWRDERRIPFEAYDREGEPCRRCGTRIRRIEQAARGTWFCPRCQRPPTQGPR